MFEHFTFGARPQLRHLLHDDSYPSPKDTSVPSPATSSTNSPPFFWNPNQTGINDIMAMLSQQNLREQSRNQLVLHFKAWQNDPEHLEVDDGEIEADDEEMEISSASFPEQGTQTASFMPISLNHGTTLCRRLQRQVNVQLQSCSSHVKDINSLVEDMIASSSQCILRKTTPRSYLPSPPSSTGSDTEELAAEPYQLDESRIEPDDIDEGFCEGEDQDEELEMSLWQASSPSGIRKHHLRYPRSGDILNVGSRIKVRSLPRMRKRKPNISRAPE